MNYEPQDIIAIVKGHLNNCHPEGLELQIVERRVYKDQDWWYLPVQPNRNPSNTIEYYEALAEVENDVLDDDGIIVLLVPVYAEELSENKSVA